MELHDFYIDEKNICMRIFFLIHCFPCCAILPQYYTYRRCLFTFCISGLVAMIQKSGGIGGMIHDMAPYVTNTRRGLTVTFLAGLAIFFDNYASVLMVGRMMPPLTDVLSISREKIAFVVDATAAPVASLNPVSSWIGFEIGLIQTELDKIVARDGTDGLLIVTGGFEVFLKSIKYRFYPIFMILLVLVLIVSGRDFGPMLIAERKTQSYRRKDGGDGKVFTRGRWDSIAEPRDDMPKKSWNMWIPIGFLIGFMIYFFRTTVTGQTDNQQDLADTLQALIWSVFGTALLTQAFYLLQFHRGGEIVNFNQTWTEEEELDTDEENDFGDSNDNDGAMETGDKSDVENNKNGDSEAEMPGQPLETSLSLDPSVVQRQFEVQNEVLQSFSEIGFEVAERPSAEDENKSPTSLRDKKSPTSKKAASPKSFQLPSGISVDEQLPTPTANVPHELAPKKSPKPASERGEGSGSINETEENKLHVLLNVSDGIESFLDGMTRIFPAIIILTLAWAASSLIATVGTDRLIAGLITGDTLSPELLPTMSFLVSMLLSLVTGSSWGTMALVFPLITVPSYDASGGDPDIFYNTIAGILSGAVAGDHMSPFSDTTVLTALATDCNLYAHLSTQVPYVVCVCLLSVFMGTYPVGSSVYHTGVAYVLAAIFMILFAFLLCGNVIDRKGNFDTITELYMYCRPHSNLHQLKADSSAAYTTLENEKQVRRIERERRRLAQESARRRRRLAREREKMRLKQYPAIERGGETTDEETIPSHGSKPVNSPKEENVKKSDTYDVEATSPKLKLPASPTMKNASTVEALSTLRSQSAVTAPSTFGAAPSLIGSSTEVSGPEASRATSMSEDSSYGQKGHMNMTPGEWGQAVAHLYGELGRSVDEGFLGDILDDIESEVGREIRRFQDNSYDQSEDAYTYRTLDTDFDSTQGSFASNSYIQRMRDAASFGSRKFRKGGQQKKLLRRMRGKRDAPRDNKVQSPTRKTPTLEKEKRSRTVEEEKTTKPSNRTPKQENKTKRTANVSRDDAAVVSPTNRNKVESNPPVRKSILTTSKKRAASQAPKTKQGKRRIDSEIDSEVDSEFDSDCDSREESLVTEQVTYVSEEGTFATEIEMYPKQSGFSELISDAITDMLSDDSYVSNDDMDDTRFARRRQSKRRAHSRSRSPSRRGPPTPARKSAKPQHPQQRPRSPTPSHRHAGARQGPPTPARSSKRPEKIVNGKPRPRSPTPARDGVTESARARSPNPNRRSKPPTGSRAKSHSPSRRKAQGRPAPKPPLPSRSTSAKNLVRGRSTQPRGEAGTAPPTNGTVPSALTDGPEGGDETDKSNSQATTKRCDQFVF